MQDRSITDFLLNEYKDYALYSIEGRAISSVIDGFKPVQRKIINASINVWKTGSEKYLKVFQLSGIVSSTQFYHHGDMSMNNAIINMAQKFKNNTPLLEEEGQFGSLRSTQAGAPRYIGTKLSDHFKLIYKDFELIEYKEEENELIEPNYFLPIIPMILVNGSSGIAVGFASNILNRNIIDVIDECISYLKTGKCKNIKPSLNVFKGDYIQDIENNKKWIIKGIYEKNGPSIITIKELPPSITYDKYEEILDKLVESKDIVGYDDNCKDNIDYKIKFTRVNLESKTDQQIIKLLKIEDSETENFCTLDEYGKLKIFESSGEIVKYFVDFRLDFYQKRKDFIIKKLQNDLKLLSNKGRFISLVIDNKILINKKTKEEIVNQISSFSIEMFDDSYDYLLRMPIHSLSIDMFNKIKGEFSSKKEEVSKAETLDVKDMYLLDLKDLKKYFNK